VCRHKKFRSAECQIWLSEQKRLESSVKGCRVVSPTSRKKDVDAKLIYKRKDGDWLVPDFEAEYDAVMSMSVRLVPLVLDLQLFQRSALICVDRHEQQSYSDHQQLHCVTSTYTCTQKLYKSHCNHSSRSRFFAEKIVILCGIAYPPPQTLPVSQLSKVLWYELIWHSFLKCTWFFSLCIARTVPRNYLMVY